ncbi:MAG: penicillin-binding protein 1A [Alphaproteobacteria bacterium]
MAGSERRRGGRPARRPFKTFVFGFFLLALALAGSGAALVYREFNESLPPVDKLLDWRPPVATRVYAADGSLLGEFFTEKRYLVPIQKIPRGVQYAFVAAEDSKFFEHQGIDPAGILRAALKNSIAGGTRQGGSTITQQVVKSLLLTPERSYERKAKELVLAYRLEHQFTKDEILYVYLNQIYLGDGAYGVQAAAREYFEKDLSELTLGETALLAGLPQAPSRYAPREHLRAAKARQRYVLERMVEEGFVSRAEAERAAAEAITIAPSRPATAAAAPYFLQHVRRLLEERYGASGPEQLGLQVWTTLDLPTQKAAERAVAAGISELDGRQGFRGPIRRLDAESLAEVEAAAAAHGDRVEPLPAVGSTLEAVVVAPRAGARRDGATPLHWAKGNATISARGLSWANRTGYAPRPGDVLDVKVVAGPSGRPELVLSGSNGTQAALVAMVPSSGDARALVGGVDFAQSQFNRAPQALRQPGSAFKPLVYAAALDHGYTAASIVDDSPVSYAMGGGERWSPQNFDHRYHGPTTLRDALTHSRNVVTVKLVDAVGIDKVVDYLPRFGFERRFPRNLSIGLGTSEASLLEMIEAYGVFPNLGVRVEPRFITRIVDAKGRVVDDGAVKGKRVLSQDTAYLMESMMRSVVEQGTGKKAADLGRPVAGKTGTTNDGRDAWFIGFTPDLLAGVWVGYDQDKTLGEKETGGQAAAPIWEDFMTQATEGTPVNDFPVPRDIVLVNVDRRSGLRADGDTENPRLEAFRSGTEPTTFAPPPKGRRKPAVDELGLPVEDDLDAARLRDLREGRGF